MDERICKLIHGGHSPELSWAECDECPHEIFNEKQAQNQLHLLCCDCFIRNALDNPEIGAKWAEKMAKDEKLLEEIEKKGWGRNAVEVCLKVFARLLRERK